MRKRWPIALATIGLIIGFVAVPSTTAETLRYREVTEGSTSYAVIEIGRDGGRIAMSKDFPENRGAEYCDDAWITEEITLTANGKNGVVTRDGNHLVVDWEDGTSSRYKIDPNPWRQSLFNLREPVSDPDTKKITFWLISARIQKSETAPPSLNTMKFHLKKMAEETVEIDGAPWDTVRMAFRPDGFAGLFWSAQYWYRLSDGVLVKYEIPRGPPGTPITYGELVSDGSE